MRAECSTAFAAWRCFGNDAGADLIGVGDAAASLIGPDIYERLVFPYEKRLVDAIHKMGAAVRLHICGNTRPLLSIMGRLGCDIYDLDYFSPLGEARQAMGPTPALLGNLHPVQLLRNGTPQAILTALRQCHQEAGPRYIVGAGCEIPRGTPDENLRALQEYARAHRAECRPVV
jgi:MtaA/CmuA family methyltransferase